MTSKEQHVTKVRAVKLYPLARLFSAWPIEMHPRVILSGKTWHAAERAIRGVAVGRPKLIEQTLYSLPPDSIGLR